MKLFWSPRSPFVRKVMIVLHETDQVAAVTLERQVVAMSVPNDAVLAMNPLNKIPTLVLDDGRVLFDSRVICEYLDRGHRLFPVEPDAYFTALTRQSLGDGLMDLLLVWRNWYLERDLAFDDIADPYVAAFLRKATATLDHLDALAPELAADPFTIGHVSIGCALGLLDFRWPELDWRRGRPALTAWSAELARRASVQATLPTLDEPIPAGEHS
jgi:glutathione S-transferase